MFAWLTRLLPRSAVTVRRQILSGAAGSYLCIKEGLDFSGSVELLVLPDDLRVPRLDVSNCRQLRGLPVGLQCGELILRRTNFESLPADLAAKYIDAQDCRRLKVVPPLQVETLRLRGCAAVEALPEGLAARDLFWGAVYGLPRCQQARRLRLGKSI